MLVLLAFLLFLIACQRGKDTVVVVFVVVLSCGDTIGLCVCFCRCCLTLYEKLLPPFFLLVSFLCNTTGSTSFSYSSLSLSLSSSSTSLLLYQMPMTAPVTVTVTAAGSFCSFSSSLILSSSSFSTSLLSSLSSSSLLS